MAPTDPKCYPVCASVPPTGEPQFNLRRSLNYLSLAPQLQARELSFINISIIAPNAPERQQVCHVRARASTTPHFESSVNITIASPANLEEQKTIDAPTPPNPNNAYRSQLRHIFPQDLVTELIVPKVNPILREKTVHPSLILGSSLIVGSRQYYHPLFSLTISEIRNTLFPKPEDSKRGMIDKTVDAMLKAWKGKCQRAIPQYLHEMHRSLVIEAERDIKAVKDEVLEAAEEQLEGRLHAFEMSLPSTLTQVTSKADALVQGFQDSNVSSSQQHPSISSLPRKRTPESWGPRVLLTPSKFMLPLVPATFVPTTPKPSFGSRLTSPSSCTIGRPGTPIGNPVTLTKTRRHSNEYDDFTPFP
ncbi:hypothetical protein GQX73_g9046 [Xylaria multiplex]|uniref:Uncharacterized protein n=1 Tax=Xylaria multiplex TaxID=323545 RepID=A0A7C8IIJ4_9PEZI|nr:hypothetical protein GQX73_g9046 [Xylaria multiplex]